VSTVPAKLSCNGPAHWPNTSPAQLQSSQRFTCQHARLGQQTPTNCHVAVSDRWHCADRRPSPSPTCHSSLSPTAVQHRGEIFFFTIAISLGHRTLRISSYTLRRSVLLVRRTPLIGDAPPPSGESSLSNTASSCGPERRALYFSPTSRAPARRPPLFAATVAPDEPPPQSTLVVALMRIRASPTVLSSSS
jgi:hypothetical protein